MNRKRREEDGNKARRGECVRCLGSGVVVAKASNLGERERETDFASSSDSVICRTRVVVDDARRDCPIWSVQEWTREWAWHQWWVTTVAI